MKTEEELTTHEEQEVARRPGYRAVFVACCVVVVYVAASAVALLIYTVARGPLDTPSPVSAQPPAPIDEVDVVTDFGSIVRDLTNTAHRLRLHPDPAGVAAYLDPENPDYDDAVNYQGSLADGTLRYDPPPLSLVVDAVHLLAQMPDTATVSVDYASIPAYRVVTRDGRVVVNSPATGPSSAVLTLRRADGQWRILGTERI